MSDRPQYEHDARKGETRYPPPEGEQYGGRPGERDPHSRLNTPLSELDLQAGDEHVADAAPFAASSEDESADERRADREETDPVEAIREADDGNAEEALRRAEEEAGGAIGRDH